MNDNRHAASPPHHAALALLVPLAVLAAAPPAYAQQETIEQSASVERETAPERTEALEALVAPIALYSDALLAQVLMASTYPLEIVEAARWVEANKSLQGAARDAALAAKPWDQSVKALVQVPSVLAEMDKQLEWTQRLGDAFLARQANVMAAVQRLRQRADDNGHLADSRQQRIVHSDGAIVIEQPEPDVIYVPAYDPYIVYGDWPYPAYPPYFWGAYYDGLYGPFFWGAPIFVSAFVWNDWFDWGHHNIHCHDGNRHGNWKGRHTADRKNDRVWRHDAAHRRGVDYRDQGVRERFGRDQRASGIGRNTRDFDSFRANAPRFGDRDINAARTGASAFDARARAGDRPTRPDARSGQWEDFYTHTGRSAAPRNGWSGPSSGVRQEGFRGIRSRDFGAGQQRSFGGTRPSFSGMRGGARPSGATSMGRGGMHGGMRSGRRR